MAASEGTMTALAVRGGTTPVPNDRVRLRSTTWREQLGLVVALPFLFLLWAVIPIAMWGVWPSIVFGALVGFVPSAVVYRGRHALRRARKRLALPAEALPRLEKVARGALVGTAVRCDALAHSALLRLEKGELEAALSLLRTPLRDGDSSVRARTPMVGYYGEVVRSVMAWLFPEAGLEPIAARVLRPSQEAGVQVGYEGVADMLAMLRLLEASAGKSAATVRRAWAEVDTEHLAQHHPLLCALALGVACRLDPSLRTELDRATSELSEPARAVLLRSFPELQEVGGASYRQPAADSVALQRVAPAELRSLHAREGLSRWFPFTARGGPWTAFFALWIVLAGVGAADGVLVVVGAVFAVLGAGAALHRRDRVRPFLDAGITAPARIRELSLMATRAGPRTFGTPTPHPFDRGELMLVVGLARAERALRDGDLDAAREQIGWWFEGLDHATLSTLDLHAVAGSVLRVGTLLGYREAALYLNSWVRERRGGRGRPRTGHGNAPRALWLARAVYCETYGDAQTAANAIDLAASSQEVVLDPFERELYGELLRRIAARGNVIPEPLRPLIARGDPPSWIAEVWPQTVRDPGTVPSETAARALRGLPAKG